jgi:tetratricopeptide (TPR) repeat protein
MRRLLALLSPLILAAPLPAQTLGRIDFPNSGKPEAQAPFLRGVLLLHSFEYEDAAQAFRQAQQAEPGFALAYWGEAMTYTHPLWNQQDVAAARAVLERLDPTPAGRRGRAGTEREQLYLGAVEALYYGKGSKERRDTLYSEAMDRLSTANPDDDEARAFYALSLMGLSQGVRNIPTYMRAGALAAEINRRNPLHPGALHYMIHAFDDPIHAPLGLFAAREYSRIAADADHAQHMTTHIFLALGMWRETVSQNAIAAGADTSTWRPGHYTAWHNYGLIQLGQYDAARRYLELMRRNLATAPTAGRQSYMLSMRAHYLIGTERWDDSVADWSIEAPLAAAGPRAIDAYAVGVALLRRGKRAEAERTLSRLEGIAKATQTDNLYGANPRVPAILAGQLRAQLLWDRGRKADALALLRRVAGEADALPMEYGPPDIVKPTHELLGELLLAEQEPAEAQREFLRALELTRGRSLSLLGLERAAREAGDVAAAERARTSLEDNWRDSDAGLLERMPQRAERR